MSRVAAEDAAGPLESIHGFIKGTGTFPIQKWAIFCKFKEFCAICAEASSRTPHKRFRRTRQVFSVVDAEIAEKEHLWTETSSFRRA